MNFDMIFVRRDVLEKLKQRTGITFVSDLRGLMYTDKKVHDKTQALREAGELTQVLKDNPSQIVAAVKQDMQHEGLIKDLVTV